jgi:hypothetical protein
MLRLDGEVFLLGTAIAAPVSQSSKKIGDSPRLFQRETRGGGRIVANGASYSEMESQRKASGAG